MSFSPHYLQRNVHLIQLAGASQTEVFVQGVPGSTESQKTNMIDILWDYQFYLMLSNLKT